MRFLITGGAGFIGSALARHLVSQPKTNVLVVDKLTYAGRRENLADVFGQDNFAFAEADICNAADIRHALDMFRPNIVVHLAAESHVDRSIDAPHIFVMTNVSGTVTLLEESLRYFRTLRDDDAEMFRFHHVSTDEVFGSLGPGGLFSETSPYDPRSPYSASKASADHFVRAWHHTFGLPVVLSNCSNNYGPHQFPEKLIPLAMQNAIDRCPIPVYGDGRQIRDWLYVDDHVRALCLVATRGQPGETYAIGGSSEKQNIDVVHAICALIDELVPDDGPKRETLIEHVVDRPGHDRRYAIDASRMHGELGWTPQETFETGLRKTVRWYLDNRAWVEAIKATTYAGDRLGVAR